MTNSAINTWWKKKPLLTAWLINSLLFAAVMLMGCPVYHSGDELNMLQTLAGGYGVPASACLPFLHNMHYFLNVPLKYLFLHAPGINWFSLSLILAQYFSCISLCYVLLCRKNFIVAIISYLAAFLVFEIWMVLYLHTSATSMVCALAGLSLIWHYFQTASTRPVILICGILVMVAGALFRIHTLVPVIALTAPFFLLLPGIRKIVVALAAMAAVFLLVIVLLKLQQQYYNTHYAAWEQEEQYRQAKYNYINYRTDTTHTELIPYRLEVNMTENLLLFDTTLPNIKTLNSIALAARTTMPAAQFFSTTTWYWDFINNRLYLFALLLSLFLFVFRKKERLVIGIACVAGLGLISYLMIARKMPEFMIPGIFFTLSWFIILTGEYKTPTSRYKQWLNGILLVSLFTWAAWRCYKMNQHNEIAFQQFQLMHHELASQPDKLFINTGDGDLFSYFYCFATPQRYPFNNILFIDHPVTSRLPYLSSQFGVTAIKQAPLHNNVYFRGPEIPALVLYYQKVSGRTAMYTDTIPGFQYSTIRKIIIR
jgi:hypothetical protein